MENSLFYNHIEENDNNKEVVKLLKQFADEHSNEQLYLITNPLGSKQYKLEYKENVIVILSPKHKIIFIDLNNNPEKFKKFYNRFIFNLNSLSEKFDYIDFIGYPDEWQEELTEKTALNTVSYEEIKKLFDNNKLDKKLQRKCSLLISLLIGSINDIDKVGVDIPETLLEKVKKNIILFDGDQTRFIYKNFTNKTVSIQGLSGTGKTELLLHKLKELYTSENDSKIFFTCHNVALANTLKERIPMFFNFMKVEKQIEWNKRLWVDRAWGSQRDKNSGLYSYLCHFYNIPFLRYSYTNDYNKIFTQVLNYINKLDKDEFEYPFDYILIDERQDFPKVFFDLCKKIARKKVYIAGDIFQDIFENTQDNELEVDVILNRCYRTDPRTLMFAHAIGMGLFEEKKFNWLTDKYWEAIGYKIDRTGQKLCLSREPIRRFEELEIENIDSMVIDKYSKKNQVIDILKKIQHNHPTVTPNDIAIIILDNNKTIYEYIDSLGYKILEKLGWEINRAYDTKRKQDNTLFVSNINNVKGLEFPFVICITAKIKNDIKYRNSLYTMLTRSFIQSYLLVKNDNNLEVQQNGLKVINEQKCIITNEPTTEEKDEIKNTIIKLQKEINISYKDFLTKIFNDLKIDTPCRKKFEKALIDAEIEKFDKDSTIDFIETNKRFFCK